MKVVSESKISMISKSFWKTSSEKQCNAFEDSSMRDFKSDPAPTKHKYSFFYLDFDIQFRGRCSKARSWIIPTKFDLDYTWNKIITKKEINADGALQWETKKEPYNEKMF